MRAAQSGVVIVVEPELGSLVARGPDRASWLNGIVSCDVSTVSPGVGAWGLALNKQGKIVSDLSVVAGADLLLLSTAPGKASELCAAFDRMLVMEDAEIEDATGSFAWVRLHGPRAAESSAAVAPQFGAAHGAIDWTGLGGAAIAVARAELEPLQAALLARAGAAGLRASADDWERLRILRGVPRFGVDFDSRDNPHEASLDQRAISWKKGCYLGQEVVCMQDMRGRVKRRVVLLSLESATPPAAGSPVSSDGDSVGEITSASPANGGGSVALARVRAPFDEPGRVLQVDGRSASVKR
jgi:tRNA-modifying protein YgfZ